MSNKQPTAIADDTVDPRVIRALGHPLRMRILTLLNQRVASPAGLARELGAPLGQVSYHVKILRECEAIELVRTEPVRGAIEHFYRPTMRAELDDPTWARLPLSVRREIAGQTVGQIVDRLGEAVEGDGFDDERIHVSWTPLELDGAGYDAIVDLLAKTLERVVEIQAESTNRAARGDGAAARHRTGVAILHFGRPEASPKPG